MSWTKPGYHDDAGHIVDRNLETIDPGDIVAPFEVRRIYCLYGAPPGAVRGRHAHRRLQQLMTCPAGSCRVDLEDASGQRSVLLDHPTQGLLIGPGTWRELRDFSRDCVVVVLASEPYDESDYLRDYAAFRKEIGRPLGEGEC